MLKHLGEDELFEKTDEMIRNANTIPATSQPASK
jgi:hypothetical protein